MPTSEVEDGDALAFRVQAQVVLLDDVIQAVANKTLEFLKITLRLAVPGPLQDQNSTAMLVWPLQKDLLSRQFLLYFILHINSNLAICGDSCEAFSWCTPYCHY